MIKYYIKFNSVVLVAFFFLSTKGLKSAVKDTSATKYTFFQNHKSDGLIICNYRLTYHPDSSDTNTRSEYLQLSIGKYLTKFQSPSSRMRDSLTSIAVNLPRAERTQTTIDFYTRNILSLPKSNFRYIILKVPSTGKISYYDWIGPNLYRYEEPDPLFKWAITNTKTTIAGYACQKATTAFAGRKFEAWFTREIPVSDGPYKFNGLPGLITKVRDLDNQYSFELVKISRIQSVNGITLPGKPAILTTKKALQTGQESYNAGLADRMASMGNNINASNQQRSKRHLNPLEVR